MCSPLKRAETFVAQRVHFVFSGVLGGPSRLVTADGELLPAQLSATVGRSQAWDEGTPGSQASPAPRGFRRPSAKQPSAHAASPPERPTCPCLPATYASAPGVPDRRSAPHGSPLSSCSSVTALLTPRHVAPPPRTGTCSFNPRTRAGEFGLARLSPRGKRIQRQSSGPHAAPRLQS